MASTVIIYDPVLTAMSEPGGMVWKWAYQRSRKVERLAKTFAPKATGNMARQITSSYDKVPNGVVMYVESPAWYSIYPHEGTSPWVNPTKMRIPPGAGTKGGRPTYTYFRRGQRAKPFLTDALITVMRDL
jgi:hypothetical protein